MDIIILILFDGLLISWYIICKLKVLFDIRLVWYFGCFCFYYVNCVFCGFFYLMEYVGNVWDWLMIWIELIFEILNIIGFWYLNKIRCYVVL